MAHQRGFEVFEKVDVQSLFVQPSASRPLSQATKMYDNDFEADLSDFEEGGWLSTCNPTKSTCTCYFRESAGRGKPRSTCTGRGN